LILSVTGPRAWSRPYRCFQCARDGRGRIAATIRLFLGTSVGGVMAGGYPACDEHANAEIEAALTALFRNGDRTWRLVAHRVEVDDDGWPMLGRVIFTARPKPLPFKDLHHATAPS